MVRHPLTRRLSLYSYARHPNQDVWDGASADAWRRRQAADPCGCDASVPFGDCVMRAVAKKHACEWPRSTAR